MATAAVVIFGFLSAVQLPVELLPDLAYPSITVQTRYPDAAPVSVEQFVTRPVEEAVGVIPGLRDMRSTSRAGISEVVLEFRWDENMDFTAMDVREKLGLVQLPREADQPRVLRYDPALDPILRVALTGDRDLDELRQLADRWIKPRLEAVRGVASAKVRGGLDPEILVEADEDRLAALGLTLDDLAAALRSENVNQPGGILKDWGSVYLIRTLHEFQDLEQVRRTVIRDMEHGRVRIEDVAEVSRGHRDREEITGHDGAETVEIALHREGSANTLAVAAAIREELDRIGVELGEGCRLTVLTDQSGYIEEAVGQVWTAALIGVVLAVLVLYFFLRKFWATLIVAMTIPVSVFAAFLPMKLAGVNLNIMSLGGLALGVGMLVDNSIVVLEAIDRRKKEGLDRREATRLGAGEVAGAVTAATLTTICVFLPIVFVRGVAGQLFYDLSVTVCLSLVASLAVSLTLIPSLSSLGFDRGLFRGRPTLFRWDERVEIERDGSSAALLLWRFFLYGGSRSRRIPWILLNYSVLLLPRLLALPLSLVFLILQLPVGILFPWIGSVRLGRIHLQPLGDPAHPTSRLLTVYLFPARLAVVIVVGVIWGALQAFARLFDVLTWPATKAFEKVRRSYPGLLSASLRLRWAVLPVTFALFVAILSAVPLLGTDLVPDLAQGEFAFRLRTPEGTPLESTADLVGRVEDRFAGDPAFRTVFSVVGSLPSTASGRQTLGENLAQINFVLPERAGAEMEQDAVRRVREVLASFPNLESELVRPSVLSLQPPVEVKIFSENLEDLDLAAAAVADAILPIRGIRDVSSTVEPGNPEIRVEIDRERAGALGVRAEDLGRSLRRQIRGEVVGQFREGEERLDIRLRASEPFRDRATEIGSLRIRLAGGGTVPVTAFAAVDVGRGPGAIHRSRGRVARVAARSEAEDLGTLLGRVREAVAATELPAGTVAELSGRNTELQVSFDSLKLAIALAVFLVYVVMAMQFESLLHPFVILLSVPLGAIGVVAALFATGITVNVLVLIGAVMLSGIVVNNSIVLVDAVNRRRRTGASPREALMEAGKERFRPILMTTITTVLALLPMALGLGAGDELRAPLAVTVIGGLSVATLLTLVFIPCLYLVLSFTRERDGTHPTAAEEAR
jgi:HAE1 family hydrophobic/amphiphilic exporter-1